MLRKRGSDANSCCCFALTTLYNPPPSSLNPRKPFDLGDLIGEDSGGEHKLTTIQPSPEAAIELIHKQPVRWVHERQVSCDGGGGPLGHPRVYVNVDKPQICTCGYCGLPFVSTSNPPLGSSPIPASNQWRASPDGSTEKCEDEMLTRF